MMSGIPQEASGAEAAPIPQFYVDPSVKPEDAAKLETLRGVIIDAPKAALDGLALATDHPEAVAKVMQLWTVHGEDGIAALGAVSAVWDAKTDRDVSFDDETEDAIAAHADFAWAQRTADSEKRTHQIRKLRLRIFIERSAKAKETEDPAA